MMTRPQRTLAQMTTPLKLRMTIWIYRYWNHRNQLTPPREAQQSAFWYRKMFSLLPPHKWNIIFDNQKQVG